MKTVKRQAAALMLMISMATFANDLKGNDSNRNVSITKDNKKVEVMILNTEAATYELTIYDSTGESVYEGELGNEISIGKIFDFNNVRKGTYTFNFTSSTGEKYSYKVNTGNRF